jgi:hypothetical protein
MGMPFHVELLQITPSAYPILARAEILGWLAETTKSGSRDEVL